MNKAIDYLTRYSTSKHQLHEILGRFASRKLHKHDPDKIATAINTTVTRCQTMGYLDDEAFAQSQARNHRRQGRSKLGIRQRLQQHRIDDKIIDVALALADQHTENGELLAACLFARRRRLGPFDQRQYRNKNDRQLNIRRQLGSLARAGFKKSISYTVIGLENTNAAQVLIDRLENGEDPII